MRLVLGNVHTLVEDATSEERHWIGEYLSFTDKTYMPLSNTFRTERVSLFKAGSFPAGLARAVYDQAKERGSAVEVRDMRVAPCKPNPAADLGWLSRHPAVAGPITHQTDSVKAAVTRQRGVLWLPTGAGKTEIAAGIVKALPCRWLFFVHRADLLNQTAERFAKRLGEPIGRVGDGVTDVQRVTVCMFQTAARLQKDGHAGALLNQAEGIIVDECHAMPAQTFYDVVMSCDNAYYRIGLSGTPLARGDSRNLLVVGGLGKVIHRVMPETLIQLGLLARPNIRMVEVAQQSNKPTWQGVYGEAIVRSPERNKAVVEVVKRATKPCLVFVQQVKHGQNVVKLLERVGVVAEFAWGAKSTASRKAAIDRLVRRDTQALVCNVVFQEGIDIPSLASVVVATAGKSTIAALQRIGRGMRADATTGKREFEVWDIADAGCGCQPTDDFGQHKGCKWLDKHTKARARAYENEGFLVSREGKQLTIGDRALLPSSIQA